MILPYIALGTACALPGIAYAYVCHRQKTRKKHRLAESELILDHMNAYFILIDSDFKVLRTNYYTLNHIPASDEPKRVGDLLQCRNALESHGCGTHELCKICGIQAAIGRALMNAPAVVLADEPTGNLDSRNSQEIVDLLKVSNQKYNQTLIIITHDENIALQADRILAIEDGKITRDEVIRR